MSENTNTEASASTAAAPQVKKFSFAKPGAAPAVPVEQLPEGTQPAQEAAPQQQLATQPTYSPPAFYTGEDDEPVDAGDVRYPRLNIVQKSSGDELQKHGVGSLVLKQRTKIPLPARLVVVGFRPKVWIEKTKFGGSTQPRIARTLDEVARFNGTDSWRASKENDKITSNKPWFMPSVTALVLVERGEGVAEDDFPFVVGDKSYAPALLSVKSTNYNAFFTTIQSEKVMGVLRKGYNTRFITTEIKITEFSGGSAGVFKLGFGEETSQELRDLAKQVSGN